MKKFALIFCGFFSVVSLATDDFDAPIDFSPIEASSVSEKSSTAKAPIIEKKIPDELNRPLKVGVFIDEKELYLLRNGEQIKITPSKGSIKFQGDKESFIVKEKEIYSEGKCIFLAPNKKQLSTSCFPGYFVLSANNGRINAINVVEIEDYLKGVIPYEIGKLDSSKFEALKAQAVAARTYAYKHFGSREASGFDVYADTKDQVYKGYQNATPLTDSAVALTFGEVMTYNGDFITAYYHSTCGGMSETLETWSRPNAPYLQSKPDLKKDGTPWCKESSYSSWEKQFNEQELVYLFQKNAKEAKAKIQPFKKIKAISVKDTLISGRILTLSVTTEKETFEVIGDKIRWLFKKDGTILPSSFFRIKKDANKWIIKGKGFGHGVGMCQMGVRARAQAGQSYLQILSHYYPNVSFERYVK